MPDSNTIGLIILGVINLFTAIVTLRQRDTIKNLEINTNSIKDALVESTAKASRAEGVVAGRAERD